MTATTRETQAPARAGQPGPKRKNRTELTYYLMLVPIVLAFTFFITLPAVEGMFYSLTNYVGYGHWHFIGLANYKAAFNDSTLIHSYGFTLLYAFVSTLVVNVSALGIALGLNSKIKWKAGFRTVYFLPMVISGLVIAYVFSYMFSNSVPIIATGLGFSPLESSILSLPHVAWIGVVLVGSWQAIPGACIIYLAGLLSIPTEVYEAASIDGANIWQQFQRVTLPLLFPFVIINSVLGLKNFLNVYDVVVGLTNGGPGTATQSVAMNIFTGFTGGDYAYQMANAVLFFIVTVTLSILQLSLTRRRGGTL